MTSEDETMTVARLSATLDLLMRATALHQTVAATENMNDYNSRIGNETARVCTALAQRASVLADRLLVPEDKQPPLVLADDPGQVAKAVAAEFHRMPGGCAV